VTRILTVSPLVWQNGHEYVLLALAALRQGLLPEFRYLLVGGGPQIRAVMLARSQLGLTDVVSVNRRLTPLQIRRELRRTDVFVHAPVEPSNSEIPKAVIHRRIPVVCTDVVETASSLPDVYPLRRVPRWRPDALAEAMAGLARGSRSQVA